jgi:carbon monoxide dehydrogenase subunit G
MELDHEFTVPVPPDQAWRVLLDVERVAPCMPGASVDSFDGEEISGRLKVRLGAMTMIYRGTARFVDMDEQAHAVTIEGSGKEARGAGTAAATVRASLHGIPPEAGAGADAGEHTRVRVHTTLNITGRQAQFGRNLLAEVGGRLVERFATNLAAELSREPGSAAATGTAAGGSGAAGGDEAGSAGAGDSGPGRSGGAGADEAGGATGDEAEEESEPSEGAPGEAGRQATSAGPAKSAAPASGVGGTAGWDPRGAADSPRPGDDDAIDLLGVAGPALAKRVAPIVGGAVALLTLRWLLRRRRRRRGA